MSWFTKLMDRFAKKRPNGLVAKFREWNGGPLTDEQQKEMVDRLIEQAKKAKKK